MNESYFNQFRNQIIGIDQKIDTPIHQVQMLYADWIASGRLYAPIEKIMYEKIAPFCANTHTETSTSGALMTKAYKGAKEYIKQEVHAGENDILIFSGSGMTDSINKLQRILGLRIPENSKSFFDKIPEINSDSKPIIFITHLEHHSNHTSWLETIADVEIINPNEEGNVDLTHFSQLLNIYKNRPLKIASVSACSNVTGIFTPYYTIAEMIHQVGGFCFVDFACSAPYVQLDMHPENANQKLDAIFVSPHKFLGGPGTPGILVLDKNLVNNTIPDNPGGGTVVYTNPWKYHTYINDVEEREDGGTPAFLQGIRAALCFKLKKEMGIDKILAREEDIINKIFDGLSAIQNLHILAPNIKHRIGAISFYIDELHYNLGVKILNDYFGIQVRGGCACAGTYGHYLLNIGKEKSYEILDQMNHGDYFVRPGWIRLSIHPTFTNAEVDFIIQSIQYVAEHHQVISKKYKYVSSNNSFLHEDDLGKFEKQFIDELYKTPF